MTALETYIADLQREASVVVKETAHYDKLKALLNSVGAALRPPVVCVIQAKSEGAGIPDLALYAEHQLPDRDQPQLPFNATNRPMHGVIEAKGMGDNLQTIVHSEQVRKYFDHYRQVLVTNLISFAFVTLKDGAFDVRETYALADSAAAFMAASPRTLANDNEQPFADFLSRVMLQAAPLNTPQQVAQMLALYARAARARIEQAGDLAALNSIKKAMEQGLGLKFEEQEDGEHFFRSTMVQTLFYGVFSAWVLWHEKNPPPDAKFDLWNDTRELNVPVIQEIFEEMSRASRLRPLRLEEVLRWAADALNRVEREGFFAQMGFGDVGAHGGAPLQPGGQNAIQYFYEPFLEAFDPELRRQLGVWYTPPEVVRYMVGRVDTALREELGVADGLADESVVILDPCCGTGAFLVEVLRLIAGKLKARDGSVLAAQAVQQAIRERIFGFEILPAPFVVAHLQIGILLNHLDADFQPGQRAGVYLTNALTGWEESPQYTLDLPELKREREAAEAVKQKRPILVILGNPPYSGFAGVAMAEERTLTNAYRTTQRAPAPQGQGLNDLYVRFYRMAERRIAEQTGRGVVCYISNYSWLDGLSHTGMRERYLEAFDSIYIDNLHGDRIISEYAPDGRTSETVFAMQGSSPGIRIGTTIATMVVRGRNEQEATLYYRDMDQARAEERRAALVASLQAPDFKAQYTILKPAVEIGLPFKPRVVGADYFTWPKMTEVFLASFPGVQTSRDDVLVDIDRERLVERMEKYFDPSISHSEMRRIAPGFMDNSARYNAEVVRDELRKRGFLQDNIVRYCFRPFDTRWLYWEPETKLLDEKRADYFPHVQEGNLTLVAPQRTRHDWTPPISITRLGCRHLDERGANCFPLYLYNKLKQPALFDSDSAARRWLNLSEAAKVYIDATGADEKALFYHTLAVLHSPAYRAENAGALRQDWPRVPLPQSNAILSASAALGEQVAALLDVETPVPGVTRGDPRPELHGMAELTAASGAPDFRVTAGWGHFGVGSAVMPGRGSIAETDSPLPEGEGPGVRVYDIYLNETTCWKGVPADVWEYTLGGYQVLKKWLSYREESVLGRPLKPDEAREFMHIARRIAVLLALNPQLDANYRAVKESAGVKI